MTSTLPAFDKVEVAAVSTLYDAERADQQVHMTVALAVIAGGVTYLGVVAGQFHQLKHSDFWAVLLPFPLWMIAAFHVLLMAAIVTRNKSIMLLEARLYAATRLAAFEIPADAIGRARLRKVTDFVPQRWPLKIQSLITYGGIGLTLVSFTCFCLWNAHIVQGWTFMVVAAIPFYLVLSGCLLAAWYTVLTQRV
ncbi:hypothetical protein [Nocardia transvalensis]|uniref:hypothetical protein n=1 Tax=Nocardia transvalensis TaxID=37333 RepID=UPI0018957440|nr:hypothetical protein [Nocardia transvalensis]MBF6327734.1 hypothetical protein [Nocardia transvalensis]